MSEYDCTLKLCHILNYQLKLWRFVMFATHLNVCGQIVNLKILHSKVHCEPAHDRFCLITLLVYDVRVLYT